MCSGSLSCAWSQGPAFHCSPAVNIQRKWKRNKHVSWILQPGPSWLNFLQQCGLSLSCPLLFSTMFPNGSLSRQTHCVLPFPPCVLNKWPFYFVWAHGKSGPFQRKLKPIPSPSCSLAFPLYVLWSLCPPQSLHCHSFTTAFHFKHSRRNNTAHRNSSLSGVKHKSTCGGIVAISMC